VNNLFSAFQQEVFRPLVSLLIPGGLAITPWFVFLLIKFPTLRALASANRTETSVILVVVVLLVGLMIEAQGSRVESWLDRKANRATQGAHMRNWYDYLRTAYVADPIGRRYLRTLVLRLKFELGVAFAALVAIFGVLALWWIGVSYSIAFPLVLLAGGISTLQFREARATHKTLAVTRSEINKEIKVVAVSGSSSPARSEDRRGE
jgi:hypothetical protein